jgi:putative SOS response-associated peptidase YedK
MCGRFTLEVSPEMLEQLFGAEAIWELPPKSPRYNIAPTQDVVIVKRAKESSSKQLVLARWGLAGTAKMINARQETAFSRPPFANASRSRRCLIPADGFFEWRKAADGGKQPFRFRIADGSVFAMAGIFMRWEAPAGNVVDTCSILTTGANSVVGAVHDRMPVILERDSWEAWLDPKIRERADVEQLLVSFPAEKMVAEPVSRRVNDVNYDDAGCVEILVEGTAATAAAKQLAFELE